MNTPVKDPPVKDLPVKDPPAKDPPVKDRWDKFDILLKPLGGFVTAIAVVAAG